jgi:magnesium-transporting ATPase (P-type)
MGMSIRTAGMGGAAWVPAALPGVVSWHAGIIALGAVAVIGILRLLAERQRRKTLIALIRNAPPQTVIVQDDKGTGNSARVWMGDVVLKSSPGASSDPKA